MIKTVHDLCDYFLKIIKVYNNKSMTVWVLKMTTLFMKSVKSDLFITKRVVHLAYKCAKYCLL